MKLALFCYSRQGRDTACRVLEAFPDWEVRKFAPERYAEEFPPTICRLLEDPKLAKQLREGATLFAEENFWTWDERVEAEIREVEKLLEKES